MKLEHLCVMDGQLALRFEDGDELFLPCEVLRRHCPCAACGQNAPSQVHPDPRANRLVEIRQVGSYALLPVWQDGHSTGIYSFEYLKHLFDTIAGDDPAGG